MKSQFLVGVSALLLLLTSFYRANAQAAPPSAALLTGQLLDQTTRRPLGFVSVRVLRYPFGTVADARGRFTLTLPARYDADSVHFSLLGYASRTVAVAALRQLVASGPLLLRPQAAPLRTVRVQAPGLKRRVVGNQGNQMMLQDYTYNSAGNQLGQLIRVQHPAFLQEMSFKITHCSYDTVYFRLNVYELKGGFPGGNILPRPIYLHLSQEQTANRIYVNLRPYKLWLTEDVVLSLELVRSLPPGTLMLLANWPGGGPSYELDQTPGPLDVLNIPPKGVTDAHVRLEKQPNNGPWIKFPGVGLGLDATLLELPEQ
ncbi:MAG: carboxypeptidase-like regulatory domain-containing protein [Janthinobacterium lividum]